MASWDSGVGQWDALLSDGFRHANGMAFRSYLGQWWFDANSKAPREQYCDHTEPVGVDGDSERSQG
ncbi:MAG: hypothetical protein P8P32_11445 [Akkermansiaceae bacterium]|nr:hypothetical protein [Akkermansiaceae bacterium]